MRTKCKVAFASSHKGCQNSVLGANGSVLQHCQKVAMATFSWPSRRPPGIHAFWRLGKYMATLPGNLLAMLPNTSSCTQNTDLASFMLPYQAIEMQGRPAKSHNTHINGVLGAKTSEWWPCQKLARQVNGNIAKRLNGNLAKTLAKGQYAIKLQPCDKEPSSCLCTPSGSHFRCFSCHGGDFPNVRQEIKDLLPKTFFAPKMEPRLSNRVCVHPPVPTSGVLHGGSWRWS